MIDRTDINSFFAAEKYAVAVMNWREKQSKKDPQWWEYVTALEVGGIVIEDAELRIQWRGAKGASSDKYNCGLIYRGLRVYAVDFDPDGQHTNKVGKGRPWFGKRFGPGTHEHSWSDDGAGYAEPIEPDFGSLKALFEFFCQRAKLKILNGYVSPPSVQMSLL